MLALLLIGCRPDPAPAPVPNIVLVMTDDQRWDTLWAMPILQERLLPSSVEFTEAFVTIPMCCPERASMLSGGFPPAQTGVLTNDWPNGGALRFDDSDTMAVRFQEAGYITGLFGKYLNEYDEIAPHIPPGWTRFVTQADNAPDWSAFATAQGGSGDPGAIVEVEAYLTDWFTGQALDFIEASAREPFFLYVPVRAPHMPATPAPGDEAAFADYQWRGAGWGEADVSDKPAWVQAESPLSESGAADIDARARLQLASLQAVDRGLGALLDGLEDAGVADNTVFVFTSDNGFLWGEHNLKAKGSPYEGSIRVPLLIAAPGIPPSSSAAMVAMNLDLPATLYALAGLTEAPTEGVDLGPLLRGEASAVRDRILVEGYSSGQPIWSGVRTEATKYIEYATGETEHYDLAADPHELESLEDAPDPELTAWLAESRGLAITTDALEAAVVGEPYAATITTWGGSSPLRFSITSGTLPDGLTLADGVISGTPSAAGTSRFWVQVRDDSTSAVTGEPEQFIARYSLEIVEP